MFNKDGRESNESTDTLNDAEELQQCESVSQLQKSFDKKIEVQIDSEKPNIKTKLSCKMFMYARETIYFCLALAFTSLAVLHTLPPRISKPPIARPFFNESSIILDFYKGHLSALIDRVRDSDFSFVMYYAPWDAECQAIKQEFENAAWYYHSQVFFAAINCWHPGSECRTQYNKIIQSYPVLMIYPSRESGIQYKGIKSAAYMIRFIHSFMNPITRITSNVQLMELLKSYDAVMIGYFNFAGLTKTPGYREFYRTALRTLERDPNGEIVFVAITSPNTAKKHGITHFPSASLLMWNETLFYPEGNDWTAEVLFNWINNVVHSVVTWIQPPGSKSFTFAQYLWDGPVLFLFTPRNPLHFANDNYNLLKEIGLQYYDCFGNFQIEDIVVRLRQSRLDAASKAIEKRKRCITMLEKEKIKESILSDHDATLHKWTIKTPHCCSGTPTNKGILCTNRIDGLENVCVAPSAACRNLDIFGLKEYFNDLYVSTSKESNFNGHCSDDSCDSSVKLNEEIDSQSASAVKKAFYKNDCKKYLAGYNYHHPVFPRDPDDESNVELKLTELICKINKTLALVAIDSLQYFYFAESLGINLANITDKTSAIILDPDDESQFVMEEEFSRNALVRFINNYTNGYLRRTMRSKNRKHLVNTLTKQHAKCKEKSKICVPELSTDTFLNIVLNPDKDVVIMYHSSYCAFCSVVTYVYLTVAHYLSMMDHLEFVRIDGDNNDLPWEYTMNRYPSILFFPAKRKEDSTLFPWTLPVSVGNLLSFVLANLDEESHIEALINVCASGIEHSPTSCLSRVRSLCLDILEDHLRDFRWLRRTRTTKSVRHIFDARKRILLLKLQHVRELHLVLSNTSNLVKEKEKVQMLRKKFKKFYVKLANLWRDDSILKNPSLKSARNKVEQNGS
ncbi:PREDICTED: thioredoxin domain-containing protein 11 [Ceratosolen solmsi marchali]|uniref:Thioredoxin domain-containing protein 11 n=1 Tax=Ceratosolen solmsi marchali TaxID=326594 RepID=A0AAJ6YQD8_9HYME|nr:PREDICTED: thioredoxin domain-containing protein 11 [Ceratosolen solmsi marchali]